MTFKKVITACIALCLMATLGVAMSGCDDLGAFKNTEEYYNSFGDGKVFLIDKDGEHGYSVEEHFYNEDSREKFVTGVDHSEYVYMAIPFSSDIVMDSLALYLQSQTDVTVYISVFVTDKIPTQWKPIEDNVINGEGSDGSTDGEPTEEKKYDDPDPDTSVGEVTVHLKNGKWDSFVLDNFRVSKTMQKSIKIEGGQYVLLQIRNNSGVRILDEEKQIFVDSQTKQELPRAEKITMTNLLIRALDVKNAENVQGGE